MFLRVWSHHLSSKWEFQACLPRSSQKWEKSLHGFTCSHWLNLELYQCTHFLEPLCHMDNDIEWVSLSYMWKVFKDKILHCEAFAVDCDISNLLCKMQTQNQLKVFPITRILWKTTLLPNPSGDQNPIPSFAIASLNQPTLLHCINL